MISWDVHRTVVVVFTFPQNQGDGVWRFCTPSSQASQVSDGKESISQLILLPQAGMLLDFVSKRARSGQSLDGKPPRKTKVLQEAVWVIQLLAFFPPSE